MAVSPHYCRDLSAVMSQIAELCPLTAGSALLAVVEDPNMQQRLTHIERLPVDARISEHEYARELLYAVMNDTLPVPDFAGPGTRHTVLTVLVRPGFAVAGPHEREWATAWRYSNHLRGASTGDMVVVTEHGWYELLSHWAGSTPAMVNPQEALPPRRTSPLPCLATAARLRLVSAAAPRRRVRRAPSRRRSRTGTAACPPPRRRRAAVRGRRPCRSCQVRGSRTRRRPPHPRRSLSCHPIAAWIQSCTSRSVASAGTTMRRHAGGSIPSSRIVSRTADPSGSAEVSAVAARRASSAAFR